MLAIKTFVATAVLAAVVPVIAAPIFLDFEKSPLERGQAGDLYVDQGVVFTENAYTIHSYFSDPKPEKGANFIRFSDLNSKAALFLSSTATSADFFINVAAGFSGTFSMIYTTTQAITDGGDFVELFSGTNGTGNVVNAGSRPDPKRPGDNLPGAQLKRQGECINPADPLETLAGVYCTWSEIKLDFTDIARSVHISGASNVYFFDNMTFGLASPSPGTDVPEPGGIALSLAALGALAWTRKRYQR